MCKVYEVFIIHREVVMTDCANLDNSAFQQSWGWTPRFLEGNWRILKYDRGGVNAIATLNASPSVHFYSEVFLRVGLDSSENVGIVKILLRRTDIKSEQFNPPNRASISRGLQVSRSKEKCCRWCKQNLRYREFKF
jgi:GDP-D-mannose dehydratase